MPLRLLAAGFLFGCASAFAAHVPTCAADPNAAGIVQRLENLAAHMQRIEETHGRAEQRALMDLHLKSMQEGLRELRKRGIGEACRIEAMHALMEEMLRLHLAERESAPR